MIILMNYEKLNIWKEFIYCMICLYFLFDSQKWIKTIMIIYHSIWRIITTIIIVGCLRLVWRIWITCLMGSILWVFKLTSWSSSIINLITIAIIINSRLFQVKVRWELPSSYHVFHWLSYFGDVISMTRSKFCKNLRRCKIFRIISSLERRSICRFVTTLIWARFKNSRTKRSWGFITFMLVRWLVWAYWFCVLFFGLIWRFICIKCWYRSKIDWFKWWCIITLILLVFILV